MVSSGRRGAIFLTRVCFFQIKVHPIGQQLIYAHVLRITVIDNAFLGFLFRLVILLLLQHLMMYEIYILIHSQTYNWFYFVSRFHHAIWVASRHISQYFDEYLIPISYQTSSIHILCVKWAERNYIEYRDIF